jgi:hypothetical protein
MHPRRNPDVKSSLLPDGYVVLSCSKTDWAHTINPVGALVWEFCDGEHSLEQIAGEISGIIPGDQLPDLDQQISLFVDELLVSGLLVDVGS